MSLEDMDLQVGDTLRTCGLTADYSRALDASGKIASNCFTFDRPMTVTKVGLYVVSVAGTVPTYRVSLEGASSYLPNGTILGVGNSAYVDVTPSGAGWVELTLGTALPVSDSDPSSPGDPFCVAVRHQSGTADASNYAEFRIGWTCQETNQHPSIGYHDGTSWGTETYRVAGMAVKDSTGRAIPGGCPANSVTDRPWNSGSSQPIARGLVLSVPQAWRLSGLWMASRMAAGRTYDFKVYRDTTLIETTAWSSSEQWCSSLSQSRGRIYLRPAVIDPTTGTWRLVIVPTSTNDQTDWLEVDFEDAALRRAWTGPFAYTSTDSGTISFTDLQTRSIPLVPIFDQVDVAAGGLAARPGGFIA